MDNLSQFVGFYLNIFNDHNYLDYQQHDFNYANSGNYDHLT